MIKIQSKAKQHAEAELLQLENYVVSSSTLSSKDSRRYSKKCAKKKYVYFNEVIWLMAMQIRLNMKNRSSRYDINRSRCRHGHKYTKYKICLDIMMVICIKQHLSNIWSLIHEKVQQHWDWFLKNVAYKKACTSTLPKFSVFPFLITMLFFKVNRSVEILP